MPTQGVMQWSKTSATNATADDAVNWAEGMAPSAVNNSARAEMASVAMWRDDISGTLTTGGTNTAYTLTTNATFATAAEMSGALLCIIPHTTSGAAPTLAVDGLTARQIRSATGVNIGAGSIVAGTPYHLTYIHATTEFILHGGSDVFGAVAVASLSSAGAVTATDVTGSGALSGATAAGAMLASQAEQETGTATNKLVQPGVQHYHPSAAKAWGIFAGATGTSTATYNCSTARDSEGDWTVTITNDFSTANYVVVISVSDATDTFIVRVRTQAAGSFTIKAVGLTGVEGDPDLIAFACYGDI